MAGGLVGAPTGGASTADSGAGAGAGVDADTGSLLIETGASWMRMRMAVRCGAVRLKTEWRLGMSMRDPDAEFNR